MRILIFSVHYAPEITGNAPYVTSLAESLARRGHSVQVHTSMPFYPSWKIDSSYRGNAFAEQRNGVKVHRLRHYVPGNPKPALRMASELSAGLRAATAKWGPADAIVVVSPALFHAALVLARAARRGLPTLLWIQDYYSLGAEETGVGGARVGRILRRIEGWTARRATAVVSIHERFSRYAREGLMVSGDRIRTIRNWSHVAVSDSPTEGASDSLPRSFPEEFVVLHAGNQGVKQGLTNVVEAARIADQLRLPIRFVLMGGGNQGDSLREASIGVERISFIESVDTDDFLAALRSADVLLVNELPELHEMSVPSKLTSYFAAGRPVLAATDAQSITAEEVSRAGAGLIVPAAEPVALVEAVEELRSDRAMGAELGLRGPIYCSRLLSEERAIDEFEAVLLARSNGRGRNGSTPS